MIIFSVAEMVEAERRADSAGHTYAKMMETAGAGVSKAIAEKYKPVGKKILVLVGPGNNGGDGLVAGRHLHQMGAKVVLYLQKERDPADDINMQLANNLGIKTESFDQDNNQSDLKKRAGSADIIIDALLGTGVSRPISGSIAVIISIVSRAIGRQTKSRPLMIAVDCPSGLNCDNGAFDAKGIPADLTCTFAGPKRGHFLFPGAGQCGELEIIDIGIDPAHLQDMSLHLVTQRWARQQIPTRPLDGHKGTFGRLLIMAGSLRYQGAPLLVAKAAFRSGVGLVSLAVPAGMRSTAVGQLPEATYPQIPGEEAFDAADAAYLERFIESERSKFSAAVVGPGLGEADRFMRHLLQLKRLPPLVIDADGLNFLARQPNWPRLLPNNAILTPHPGEMARLMGLQPAELAQLNRMDVAREMAQEWGTVVVLKGAYTVIGLPDGSGSLIPFANPLLSVGGSGDVLAGVIGALLAQGCPPQTAAILGAYIHGSAGEQAKSSFGDRGMLAGELTTFIPSTFTNLQDRNQNR